MPRGGLAGLPQAILDQLNGMVQKATTAASTASDQAATATTAASGVSASAADLAADVTAANLVHQQLRDAITALKQNIAVGTAPVPALLLGASSDVTLTLSRPMPTTTYQWDVIPSAAILSNTTWTLKTRTTTSITLTVKATLALAAGSQLTVITYG